MYYFDGKPRRIGNRLIYGYTFCPNDWAIPLRVVIATTGMTITVLCLHVHVVWGKKLIGELEEVM